MTTQQILLMECLYLALLGAVIHFTRATTRRSVGALAGGAAAGLLGLGAIALGDARDWWRIPPSAIPYFRLQLFLGLTISMTPTFLITWRVARRFGWRGLAVALGVVALIGPPRDCLIVAMFPTWMAFAPGVIPVLADAAAYIGMVTVGHAVMRLSAGPAYADRFSHRTGKTAPPGGGASDALSNPGIGASANGTSHRGER